MTSAAADLARRLARDAEAVCRTYLSNGRRSGAYWSVGDVKNTPGRSLYVRLNGSEQGRGAAGQWSDAATGAHGDLLDLIQYNRGFDRLADAIEEARRFLALPRKSLSPAAPSSPEAARRLFAMGRPVAGTLAETYLRARGIGPPLDWPALRFHPTCYYRAGGGSSLETWPALVAAVTALDGTLTGVQRTYLARDGSSKAPLAAPRRSLGALCGNGVRFGIAQHIVVAGEGIETVLSLATLLPGLPLVAALSASNLAALILPATLRRLYIARDNDAAGQRAVQKLAGCAAAAGIQTIVLTSTLGDFNDDLRAQGPLTARRPLLALLAPADRHRVDAALRRAARV